MTSGTGPAAVCLGDVEQLAKEILQPDIWDFIAGASGDEVTLAANRDALDRVRLVPHMLRDTSRSTTAATLLGHEAAMPVATAPIAYQRLAHPDGELAAARAAKEAGIPFTVSTLSSCPLERIAETGAAIWFQLYWLRDREKSYELVRRAEDSGVQTLMLTVDAQSMGRRMRDLRNRFTLPSGVEAANFRLSTDGASGNASIAHRHPAAGSSAVAAHTQFIFAPSVTWRDLEDLRARTSLPLLVKGLLAPEDAVHAHACGADGVVVSNHGGRQLDGVIPSVDALEAVSAAVRGRCSVLLDSGIRSGTDVLRALALGADGVLIGRPLMWGLAVGGQQGVSHVLNLLATELRGALGLSGCDHIGAARQLRTSRRPLSPGDRLAGNNDESEGRGSR